MNCCLWLPFLLSVAVINLSRGITVSELESQLAATQRTLDALSRQVMLQEFYTEDERRNSASSGIKKLRKTSVGSLPYLTSFYAGMGMHNHANNLHTVGLGEISANIHGVYFRTRHNDYRLFRKSTTSKEYGATEDIPLPDVPPAVLAKSGVNAQIEEMREWFKAWANQDRSIRDYRKYFKPILCYLEGAWTTSDSDTIDESFDSDRHFLAAKTWMDMQDKVRFATRTGRKDNDENFAVLPTTVLSVANGTLIMAQWNYKILCHPLKKDLPLNRFRLVNDMHVRMGFDVGSLEELKGTRSARFTLNTHNLDEWKENHGRPYRLIDEMMYEIPGLDNYKGNIIDDVFDLQSEHVKGGSLNSAFFHSWYRVAKKGANGLTTRARGFSDGNIFMAMNTRSKVAPAEVKVCKKNSCQTYSQRWSYAIPLEIIYLTPLGKWNPYDLPRRGDGSTEEGKSIFLFKGEPTRDGTCTKEGAFDGVNTKNTYMTPKALFEDELDPDAADTTQSSLCVLDQRGVPREVRASGVRIFLPNIPGVGIIRQRWPIFPLSEEGTSAWKEIAAIKDVLLFPDEHKPVSFTYPEQAYYTGPIQAKEYLKKSDLDALIVAGTYPRSAVFEMQPSYYTREAPPHVHQFEILKSDWPALVAEDRVTFTTTTVNEHSHEVTLQRLKRTHSDGSAYHSYKLYRCDGENFPCKDGHDRALYLVSYRKL